VGGEKVGEREGIADGLEVGIRVVGITLGL